MDLGTQWLNHDLSKASHGSGLVSPPPFGLGPALLKTQGWPSERGGGTSQTLGLYPKDIA